MGFSAFLIPLAAHADDDHDGSGGGGDGYGDDDDDDDGGDDADPDMRPTGPYNVTRPAGATPHTFCLITL